jgi:hypothetical protein
MTNSSRHQWVPSKRRVFVTDWIRAITAPREVKRGPDRGLKLFVPSGQPPKAEALLHGSETMRCTKRGYNNWPDIAEPWLLSLPGGRMLSVAATMESSMSKAGLDNRHRNHDGEISHKHGNTLVGTLRKIYGPGFAAGYPQTEKLSEVLLQLNETSLSQLRRDHETGHLDHKIGKASK